MADEHEPLAEFRWERRFIVVFASGARQNAAVAHLEANQADMTERDVSWVIIGADGSSVAYDGMPPDDTLGRSLLSLFAPISWPLDVLLIGKDGGLKQRSSRLDVPALLQQVDGMPMRRREMLERDAAADEATDRAADDEPSG